MAEPYIWGTLNRALNDPTLIDEAIGQAVAAHNDDPDAHLGDEQSLQSHRAAEIIDHLAESVVNDKIAPQARTYTAIVDPSSETDYSSVQSALDYVAAKGGGTILIVAGTYDITDTLNIPVGVDITGQGAANTILSCDASTVPAFLFGGDELGGNRLSRIQGVGFTRVSGTVFAESPDRDASAKAVLFSDCAFGGNGNYCANVTDLFLFERCLFTANTTAALKITDGSFYDSAFSSSGAGIYFDQYAGATEGAKLTLIGCDLSTTGSQIITGNYSNSIIDRCGIGLLIDTIPLCRSGDAFNVITNSTIIANNSNDLYVRGLGCKVINNVITAETPVENGNYFRFATSSQRNIVTGNALENQIRSDKGIGNSYGNNVANYSNIFNLGEVPVILSNTSISVGSYSAPFGEVPYFSADGEIFCLISKASNLIRWWRLESGSYVRKTDITGLSLSGLDGCWFSPYAKKIVVVNSTNTTITIYDLSTGTATSQTVATGQTSPTYVNIAISGDGYTIAHAYSSNANGYSRIDFYYWNGTTYVLRSRRNLGRYRYAEDDPADWGWKFVQNMFFNKDGSYLVTTQPPDIFYSLSDYMGIVAYTVQEGMGSQIYAGPGDVGLSAVRGTMVDQNNYFDRSLTGNFPFNLSADGALVTDNIAFETVPSTYSGYTIAAQEKAILQIGRDGSSKPALFHGTNGYYAPIDRSNLPTVATNGFSGASADGRYFINVTSTTAATVYEVTYG